MAITIISQPNQYQPSYNPMRYVIDSDNKNKPGFRYIIEIYDAGTTDKLVELDIAPRPDDGYGYVDVSRIIQNKVDTFYTNDNSNNIATNTWYRYDIKFGESYLEEWSFDDYGFNNTFSGGNTGLFQSPQVIPHTFVVGDQIVVSISPSITDNREALNGYFTVIGVVNAYDIVINLYDVGSGPVTPGTIVFANNKKQRNYNLTSITGRLNINMALNINEYIYWQNTGFVYTLSTLTPGQLLTSMTELKVNLFQNLYLNAFANNTSIANYMYFENDNGTIYSSEYNTATYIKQYSVGPNNLPTLTLVSGTGNLIESDTKYYDVYTTNSSGVQTSIKYRIYIDRRCPINETQILFMDRKGSYLSLPFSLRQSESFQVKKEQFRQETPFTLTSDSKGMTTYHSEVEKMYELNSNYMDDNQYILFEEMLSSPYTYIELDNTWYSCTIMTSNGEVKKQKNKKLNRETIQIKLDLNNPVNI